MEIIILEGENQVKKSKSKSSQLSKKIKKIRKEGKSLKQSIAIALSMAGKKKRKLPKRGYRSTTNKRRR